MAFIAPSLWAVNQYGEGLRSFVRRSRQLDRWLDFKSHQIFEDVITYTALQFFTREPRDIVRIATAPNGDMADIDWSDPKLAVPYASMPETGEWLIATGAERALIERLARDCLRLDDPALTTDIFQGVKTGADQVFKLRRLGANRYLCEPDQGTAYEVEIEDDLMHPILSGPETKRYVTPSSNTNLLFPYLHSFSAVRLIPPDVFQAKFPKAWSHLTRWRPVLERRDNGALRDESWYRFSRSQSLERAGVGKLCAAGTVPSLRFAYDENGAFFLTGGRVDGVVPSKSIDPSFLLGTLNGLVCDFVFRRVGRIKQGGWYEANKQFIAPLPIPNVSASPGRHRGTRTATPRTVDASLPSPAGGGRPAVRARTGAPSGALAVARTADIAGDGRASAQGPAPRHRPPQMGRGTARRNGSGARRGAAGSA
jgi:hypothetical protein